MTSQLPRQCNGLQQILAICLKILTVEGPVQLPVRMEQSCRVTYDHSAKSKKTKSKRMSHARGTVQALALNRRVG
eukprot:11216323-Karenia_brevis.AAC.1